ncbi:DNA cytosine methyltransferase [Corynebacterium kozikiae]|uniref:DNA cytosine methyltransferase n=1 Tax=Corynebacterium kozikiae TaxID=2968469 RepID=UPI00211B8BAD|nr:DNA cytosine methyltransferase [Corynebacterium sp. 76QC2CO]MCQ9343848.1 DNA cytosine methyltransferase [Corynebacterium sp. 76QC2CO]
MKAIDLFAGCGGLSKGLELAGIEVVAAVDHWKAAREIYEANFEHPILDLDLSQPESEEFLSSFAPQIVAGGPPCQDFSISGKRQEGERANLTIRFGEIVASVKPTWVLFENVYNIQRFKTLSRLKEVLKDAGYGLSETVLDASYFGVPQKRKRYFLVGRMDEADGFFDSYFQKYAFEEPMTVAEYFGESLNTDFYYMHPRSYARRAVFSVNEPAATIRGINRPIPKNYRKHTADAASIEEGVRSLTTRERAKIQSFPDDFVLQGATTSVELAIGNAVPPLLAKAVASSILSFEQER